MEHLHNWIFTYNGLAKLWMAATRENYNDLFSNFNSPNIIKSHDIDTLTKLIIRAKGKVPTLKHLKP